MFPIPVNVGNSSTTSPNLVLNFASGTLDPRVTYTRAQAVANTVTFTGSNGLIQYATANQPRFDYNPTTLACNGLLIEESRTNLLTYSSDFTNAAWNKYLVTVVSGISAPDGSSNGCQVTASSSGGGLYQSSALSAGTYSISAYMKAGTVSAVSLYVNSGTAGAYATYDISAGTTSGVSILGGGQGTVTSWGTPTITSVGSSWYRCVWPNVVISGSNTPSISVGGVGTVNIWGAQLEAGAFPTSLIQTTTTSITRNADNASMTGTNFSSWFNASQGTILSVAIPYNVSAVRGGFVISDGTANNTIETAHGSSPRAFVNVSGSTQVSQASGSVAANATVKAALAYQLNNSNGACNGVVGTNVTTCTVPTVNQSIIGNVVGGTSALNGTISKVLFYPTRLPDSTLKGLTS